MQMTRVELARYMTPGSKPGASAFPPHLLNWGCKNRTCECESQSLMPYRLAKPQYKFFKILVEHHKNGNAATRHIKRKEENIKRKVIVYKSQILIINALIHNGLRFMYSRVRTVIYFLSKSLRTASLGELNGFV